MVLACACAFAFAASGCGKKDLRACEKDSDCGEGEQCLHYDEEESVCESGTVHLNSCTVGEHQYDPNDDSCIEPLKCTLTKRGEKSFPSADPYPDRYQCLDPNDPDDQALAAMANGGGTAGSGAGDGGGAAGSGAGTMAGTSAGSGTAGMSAGTAGMSGGGAGDCEMWTGTGLDGKANTTEWGVTMVDPAMYGHAGGSITGTYVSDGFACPSNKCKITLSAGGTGSRLHGDYGDLKLHWKIRTDASCVPDIAEDVGPNGEDWIRIIYQYDDPPAALLASTDEPADQFQQASWYRLDGVDTLSAVGIFVKK